MPRRARVTPLLVSILAWAYGFALVGTLPQASGDGERAWSGWSRAAFAQEPGAGLQPSEWRRLTGPLPYRPSEPDSGWLTETDLTRAVGLIADLGLFFAKLSETDPNLRPRLVWGQGEAAYGSAAESLGAAIQEGQFRIVISEGSSLAIIRRGEEVWVDSDLAGAWNVERVRQARWNGDDWSDVAGLSGLLFDLWRGQQTAASDAWLDHQLASLAIAKAEFEEGGTGAAAVFTRYGFLKDMFLRASLLRAATANSAKAALWRDRAQRIRQQIQTLLRSVATVGLSGDLGANLQDDWAAYAAEIEQSAAARTWLVLDARRPAAALSRIGTVPQKPEQDPRPATAEGTAAEGTAADETAADETAPTVETGPDTEVEDSRTQPANLEGSQAPDQDYIALLLARAVDAARAAEAAGSRADTMARQADAAILAADDARQALAAAEKQAAKLSAQLAAAQSGSESATEETARLRQRAEDLAAELDQARSYEAALQAQLTEAQGQASAAETAAAKTIADATAKSADLQEQLTARDADLSRAEAQTAAQDVSLAESEAEIAQLESQLETLQAAITAAASDSAALATVQSELAALQTALLDLREELATVRSRAETAEAALVQEKDRAAELGASLAEAQQALAATQDQATAEATGAAQAEAAAERAREGAEDARQNLASNQAELARVQAEIETLRQERQSAAAQTQTGGVPTPQPAWFEGRWGLLMAMALLVGSLLIGLFVLRRRGAPVSRLRPAAPETVTTAVPDEHPAPAAAPTGEPDAPKTGAAPSAPPVTPPITARPLSAPPVTSATIVEAVRRHDWVKAEALFAQLSGVSAPRLEELLSDQSGELLALACRAADLDRLTFAALYLLQGQGRAVADPEVVAGAVSLFEKTGPAEAQQLLAERCNGDSLSA